MFAISQSSVTYCAVCPELLVKFRPIIFSTWKLN